MKITDIKQQVKRHDRYSVYVDKKYSFSLSESELMSSGIRINKEYTSQEFDDLQHTAVFDKARMRALDLLARRQRGEYDSATIEKLIQSLKTSGYVDDEQFARSWLQSRRLLKNISQRRLRLELKQKRIQDRVIDKVLQEDDVDERQVLRDLIVKKQRQTKYQDAVKLMQFLSRQGFSYDDIKAVISEQDQQ
jgi:regulatory protein